MPEHDREYPNRAHDPARKVGRESHAQRAAYNEHWGTADSRGFINEESDIVAHALTYGPPSLPDGYDDHAYFAHHESATDAGYGKSEADAIARAMLAAPPTQF